MIYRFLKLLLINTNSLTQFNFRVIRFADLIFNIIVVISRRRSPYRLNLLRRKVRTPKSSIADNIRRSRLLSGLGQVQQKVCTGNAVVKPGKLYAVKFQVYQHLRVTRPLLKGRKMELVSNCKPR